MEKKENKKVIRIIDANLNRAKEGLRVCEDVARFVLDEPALTRNYKKVRHQLSTLLNGLSKDSLILTEARDIARDVGRKSTRLEFKRKNIKDVFYANSQRVKESIRVLEEFTKLTHQKKAEGFKKIRYKVYSLESDVAEKL